MSARLTAVLTWDISSSEVYGKNWTILNSYSLQIGTAYQESTTVLFLYIYDCATVSLLAQLAMQLAGLPGEGCCLHR